MKYLKQYEQFRFIIENIENLDRISTSSNDNELVRSFGDEGELVAYDFI